MSTGANDTTYDYDAQGRLWHVTVHELNGQALATPQVTTYAYDPAGNLAAVAQPDGVTTSYVYDGLNRLELETVTDNGVKVETFDYDQKLVPVAEQDHSLMLGSNGLRGGLVDTRYNADGSVFAQDTTRWQYDADGRLTDEALTVQQAASDGSTPLAYADHFTFDLANNRTEEDTTGGKDGGSGTVTYTYNEDDQLLTEARTGTNPYQTVYGHYAGTAFYKGYDADGSLVEQHRTGTNPEDDAYAYDLRNRMHTAAVTKGGVTTTTTYGYDSDGVRVSEATGTATTYYLNDPQNPTGYAKAVQESSTPGGGGAPTRSYVLGLRVEGQSDATSGTLYFLTDGHGSTRALVDLSGTVQQRLDYDAYGKLVGTVTEADAKTLWRFGGDGVYDPASGFTYHLARWTNGFWFTQMDSYGGDSADPQSLHKYVVDNGNPVYFSDPTGHEGLVSVLAALGISSIVSGLISVAVTHALTPRSLASEENLPDAFARGFLQQAFTGMFLTAELAAPPLAFLGGPFISTALGNLAGGLLVDDYEGLFSNRYSKQEQEGTLAKEIAEAALSGVLAFGFDHFLGSDMFYEEIVNAMEHFDLPEAVEYAGIKGIQLFLPKGSQLGAKLESKATAIAAKGLASAAGESAKQDLIFTLLGIGQGIVTGVYDAILTIFQAH